MMSASLRFAFSLRTAAFAASALRMSANVEPSMNVMLWSRTCPELSSSSSPRGVSPGCSSYSPAFSALSRRVRRAHATQTCG